MKYNKKKLNSQALKDNFVIITHRHTQIDFLILLFTKPKSHSKQNVVKVVVRTYKEGARGAYVGWITVKPRLEVKILVTKEASSWEYTPQCNSSGEEAI